MHEYNYVIGGAMTDAKGDRTKSPINQLDKELYLKISQRTNDGIFINGCKMHQTGCINSHYMLLIN